MRPKIHIYYGGGRYVMTENNPLYGQILMEIAIADNPRLVLETFKKQYEPTSETEPPAMQVDYYQDPMKD